MSAASRVATSEAFTASGMLSNGLRYSGVLRTQIIVEPDPQDWFCDPAKVRAWAELNSYLLKDFENRLTKVADLPYRDMTRMLLAALEAERQNRPFYVQDALVSMNPKGEDQPARSIDDPYYQRKYKRLQLAIQRGFLEQGARPEHDKRLRPVMPSQKLKQMFDEYCQAGLFRLQALLIDFREGGAHLVIVKFVGCGRTEIGCFTISCSLRVEAKGSTRDGAFSGHATLSAVIAIGIITYEFNQRPLLARAVSPRSM